MASELTWQPNEVITFLLAAVFLGIGNSSSKKSFTRAFSSDSRLDVREV